MVLLTIYLHVKDSLYGRQRIYAYDKQCILWELKAISDVENTEQLAALNRNGSC